MITIYGLADLDPDGLSIMSTYKYGSAALAHENAELNVPSLRWIGVNSSDVYSVDTASEGRGLLSLTQRDRRLARKMLERDVFAESGPEEEWRRELQIMLFTNLKTEIQVMNEGDVGFDAWLESKITAALAAQ
ncbi:MAG: hypothetical protein M1837_002273 [Sclerophora amabilis]|nr:MAG: hypothetical protein M1837_002273 [Sclerophora amabilis]